MTSYYKNALFVDGHEYCAFETFYGRCSPDEIILITQAKYGRMRVGKCIAEGLSNIFSSFIVQSINIVFSNAAVMESSRPRGLSHES